MLNENAKKWVEALRSGKYNKTKKVLRNQEGYCCLGVACEVAIENGLDLLVDSRDITYYDGIGTVLPTKVKKWLKLNSHDGTFLGGDLILLNDSELVEYTFAKIADVIESEPEGMFEGKQ